MLPSLFDITQNPQQENDLFSKFPELAKKLQNKEPFFLRLAIEMIAKKKGRRD